MDGWTYSTVPDWWDEEASQRMTIKRRRLGPISFWCVTAHDGSSSYLVCIGLTPCFTFKSL